jgi:hypothetical protein
MNDLKEKISADQVVGELLSGNKVATIGLHGQPVVVFWNDDSGKIHLDDMPTSSGYPMTWVYSQPEWYRVTTNSEGQTNDHHESSNIGSSSVSAGPLSVGHAVQSQPTTAALIAKTYSELVEIGTANLQVYMDASKYSELSDMDDAMACIEKTTLQIKTLKAFAAEIGVTI